MRAAGVLGIALAAMAAAVPASAQQRQNSAGNTRQQPLFGTVRGIDESWARRCEESRKDRQRTRAEIELKQKREHEEWHRRNDRLSGGEWLRKHQAFHQQLQRQREQSERARLKDCDEVHRAGGWDRVDDRWRKDRDVLERERNRFRGILGRRRNN